MMRNVRIGLFAITLKVANHQLVLFSLYIINTAHVQFGTLIGQCRCFSHLNNTKSLPNNLRFTIVSCLLISFVQIYLVDRIKKNRISVVLLGLCHKSDNCLNKAGTSNRVFPGNSI